MTSHRRRNFIVTGVLILAALGMILFLTGADSLCWGKRCEKINDFRADHHRAGLDQKLTLQIAADGYAEKLAATGVLTHAPCWRIGTCTGGEIVGFGPDFATILAAWKQSSCHDTPPDEPCPGHRELLLDRSFTRVGIGTQVDPTGTMWAVVRFK